MLRVCEGCERHVREGTRCPFCGEAVPVVAQGGAVSSRLGRAALMAFGAVAAAAGAASCNDAKSPNEVTVPVVDAGPTPSTTATTKPTATATASVPVGPDPNCCMPYGAPPADTMEIV